MQDHSIGEARTVIPAKWPWPLWGRWIGANALGELIGLGTSSLLWLLFFMGMETRLGTLWAAFVVVIGSTLLEGSAVGLAQWYVLRRPLPALTLRAWWVATSLGAFVAWSLGMIPSTIMALGEDAANSVPAPELSDALIYLLAALMGLVLGPVLAWSQWWVLRRHVADAWLWLPANALAWALGMPIIFAAMGLVPSDAPFAISLAVVLVGLALAGAVVGATHGLVLIRLLQIQRYLPPASPPPAIGAHQR